MKPLMILISAILFSFIPDHDIKPGAPQSKPILLKGGTIHTVSDGVKTNTDILFEKGEITQIGANLTAPVGAEIIDVSGKHIYPGLISMQSRLGIVEVNAMRASRDFNEIGTFTPEVQTRLAYNADSEVIPTVRANGVLHALVLPSGNIVSGQGSLMQLDAWNHEDATVLPDAVMRMTWPQLPWWRTPNAQDKKRFQEAIDGINRLFENAASYAKHSPKRIDQRLAAMAKVINGEMKLIVTVNRADYILDVIKLAQKYGVKLIIHGGDEAYLVADQLKKYNIPVILRGIQRMPETEDKPIRQGFMLPKMLQDLGITFVLSDDGYDTNLNLPLQAGQAVNGGLTKEQALRSVTLTAAEMLGVADRLGSLEVGKNATLVVSEGDLMDMLGNRLSHAFIEGRKLDLDNRFKRLYQKYKDRPGQ